MSAIENLYGTVVRLVALLIRNDSEWAGTIASLGAEVASAPTGVDLQRGLRRLLSIYGGTGSFSDLVLQSSTGVSPDNDELDQLRVSLFAAASEMIR